MLADPRRSETNPAGRPAQQQFLDTHAGPLLDVPSNGRNDESAKRGELFAHIRNTFHQYNLPRPADQLLYKKNREGLVEAFSDPMIRSTLEADLALADRL